MVRLFTILVLICLTQTVAFGAEDGAPKKVALIVAISDYPDSDNHRWADLPGAANDVRLVKSLLIDRFEFPEEEIKVLVDEQATHEAIVRTFHDWLIQRAGPETEVVFWYSGHGSRVPDQSKHSKVEVDNLDSTLLAWDSRQNGLDGQYDIVDDEFASLLIALTAKTGYVTIVTDSCHSGGNMRSGRRGEAGRVRAAEDGTAEHEFSRIKAFWPEGIPFHDDNETRPDPERYFHISACGPRQQALEWAYESADGPTLNGALTLFLTDRLNRASQGETYRQVVDQVERWVANQLPDQAVQYEGQADRILFGGEFPERLPGFRSYLDPDERSSVRIEAGWLHGLRVGSKLRMFTSLGEEVGRCEVLGVEATSARGIWKGALSADMKWLSLLAREESRPVGREPLRVIAGDPVLDGFLADRFAKQVELVSSGESAFRLETVPAGAAAGAGVRLRLLDPAGLPVWSEVTDGDEDDWQDQLEEELDSVLKSEQRYQSVLELVDAPGSLRMQARFVPLADGDLVGPDRGLTGKWSVNMIEAAVAPSRGGLWETATGREYFANLPEHEANSYPLACLEVTNPTSEDAYIAVLSVVEDRAIALISPARNEPPMLLPAGESRRVYTTLSVNEKLSLDRPMRDRYLVIATRASADFQPLVQQTQLRGNAPTGVPAIIENALMGSVNRGGDDVSVETTNDFGVTTVDLLVSQ